MSLSLLPSLHHAQIIFANALFTKSHNVAIKVNCCSWRIHTLHYRVNGWISRQCKEQVYINLLKPTGFLMYQQLSYAKTVSSAHTVFSCLVFMWEQTAVCATYIVNWLGRLCRYGSRCDASLSNFQRRASGLLAGNPADKVLKRQLLIWFLRRYVRNGEKHSSQ